MMASTSSAIRGPGSFMLSRRRSSPWEHAGVPRHDPFNDADDDEEDVFSANDSACCNGLCKFYGRLLRMLVPGWTVLILLAFVLIGIMLPTFRGDLVGSQPRLMGVIFAIDVGIMMACLLLRFFANVILAVYFSESRNVAGIKTALDPHISYVVFGITTLVLWQQTWLSVDAKNVIIEEAKLMSWKIFQGSNSTDVEIFYIPYFFHGVGFTPLNSTQVKSINIGHATALIWAVKDLIVRLSIFFFSINLLKNLNPLLVEYLENYSILRRLNAKCVHLSPVSCEVQDPGVAGIPEYDIIDQIRRSESVASKNGLRRQRRRICCPCRRKRSASPEYQHEDEAASARETDIEAQHAFRSGVMGTVPRPRNLTAGATAAVASSPPPLLPGESILRPRDGSLLPLPSINRSRTPSVSSHKSAKSASRIARALSRLGSTPFGKPGGVAAARRYNVELSGRVLPKFLKPEKIQTTKFHPLENLLAVKFVEQNVPVLFIHGSRVELLTKAVAREASDRLFDELLSFRMAIVAPGIPYFTQPRSTQGSSFPFPLEPAEPPAPSKLMRASTIPREPPLAEDPVEESISSTEVPAPDLQDKPQQQDQPQLPPVEVAPEPHPVAKVTPTGGVGALAVAALEAVGLVKSSEEDPHAADPPTGGHSTPPHVPPTAASAQPPPSSASSTVPPIPATSSAVASGPTAAGASSGSGATATAATVAAPGVATTQAASSLAGPGGSRGTLVARPAAAPIDLTAEGIAAEKKMHGLLAAAGGLPLGKIDSSSSAAAEDDSGAAKMLTAEDRAPSVYQIMITTPSKGQPSQPAPPSAQQALALPAPHVVQEADTLAQPGVGGPPVFEKSAEHGNALTEALRYEKRKSLPGQRVISQPGEEDMTCLTGELLSFFLNPPEVEEFIKAADYSSHGIVSRANFKRIIVSLYVKRKKLLAVSTSHDSIQTVFGRMINLFSTIAAAIIFLLLVGIDVNTLIISGAAIISSITVALSYLYSSFVQSVMFIAFLNPYNIGDRVRIEDGPTMVVKRISTFYSTFETLHGNPIVWAHNNLIMRHITNDSRSTNASLEINLLVIDTTSPRLLENLNRAIESYVVSRTDEFVKNSFYFFVTGVQPGNFVGLAYWVTCVDNWHNWRKVWSIKTSLLQAIVAKCEHVGVTYRLPVQRLECPDLGPAIRAAGQKSQSFDRGGG